MPIIIDGWNLIRHEGSGIDDDDALVGAGELIAILGKFQETHADPIILVFDSNNEYLWVSCEAPRLYRPGDDLTAGA